VFSVIIIFANDTFNPVSYFVAFDWSWQRLDTSSAVYLRSSPLFTPASLMD